MRELEQKAVAAVLRAVYTAAEARYTAVRAERIAVSVVLEHIEPEAVAVVGVEVVTVVGVVVEVVAVVGVGVEVVAVVVVEVVAVVVVVVEVVAVAGAQPRAAHRVLRLLALRTMCRMPPQDQACFRILSRLPLWEFLLLLRVHPLFEVELLLRPRGLSRRMTYRKLLRALFPRRIDYIFLS